MKTEELLTFNKAEVGGIYQGSLNTGLFYQIKSKKKRTCAVVLVTKDVLGTHIYPECSYHLFFAKKYSREEV